MTYETCSTTCKVSVSGFEKLNFHCGQGMQQNWVDNNVVLMDCVGNKFSQSVMVFMLAVKMIVAEADDKLIPKFKTEADKKTHAYGLEHWEIELHEQTKDYCTKFIRLIRKYLSYVHSMLCSLCHISLRNRLKREVD